MTTAQRSIVLAVGSPGAGSFLIVHPATIRLVQTNWASAHLNWEKPSAKVNFLFQPTAILKSPLFGLLIPASTSKLPATAVALLVFVSETRLEKLDLKIQRYVS